MVSLQNKMKKKKQTKKKDFTVSTCYQENALT